MKKLAPRMAALLRKTSHGTSPLYCHFEQVWGREAAREANALLAVARAARRMVEYVEFMTDDPLPEVDAQLQRAVRRLERASTSESRGHRGHGGRGGGGSRNGPSRRHALASRRSP